MKCLNKSCEISFHMASCCPVCGLDEKLRYVAEDPYYDAVKEYSQHNRKLKSGENFVCSNSRNA